MAFMGRRNQNKTIVFIMALLLGVAVVGSSIYYSFAGSGVSNSNTNNTSQKTEAQYLQDIKQYQDLVKKNPNDMKMVENLATFGYFELGKYYIDKKQDTKAQEQLKLAIAEFDKVVKADPKNTPSLGDMATAYYYVNQPDDAIATVRKALAIDPNFTTARMNLAVYLGFGKKDYKSAIEELNKVQKSDTNYQNAQNLINEFTNASKAPVQSGIPNNLPSAKK